jgi:hypothetical protein
MLTAAIAAPKISFDTVAMIFFSAALRGAADCSQCRQPELLQQAAVA